MRLLKKAFTISEILITMTIIAILVAVTTPFIKSQLDKSDEYYYYLAFKTVENIASKLIVLGDEEENFNTSFNYNSIIKGKSIFNALIPKAYAEFDCSDETGHLNQKSGTYGCECIDSSYVMAENNQNVCCPIQEGGQRYFATVNASGTLSCKVCAGDVNELNNKCCPAHSYFNGENCVCDDGYKVEGSTCVPSKICMSGLHFDEETEKCVPNFPVVSAARLCTLIKDNWNVTNFNCNTFSSSGNDTQYYSSVFEAVKSASSGEDYIFSINSKPNAFASITPNIVFSNGLKMWILSDRYASIPGLTYTSAGSDVLEPYTNVCHDVTNSFSESDRKTTAEKCNGANEYYCGATRHCVSIDSGSKSILGDARNCCPNADFEDLSSIVQTMGETQEFLKTDSRVMALSGFTILVDINGNKGPSTLWVDVFPFYLSTNGIVYPGYPMNAPKARNAASSSLYLGGNGSALKADVYYYRNMDDKRRKYMIYSSIPYARALCYAGKISIYSPYCQNLGEKFDGHSSAYQVCHTSKKCFVKLKSKFKFF